MGKQKGIVKIQGTFDDLTFHQSKHGYIVKKKSSLNGSRIATDPLFQRTRENGMEFANAAYASKLLRGSISRMAKNASDGAVVGRLLKVMSDVRKLDGTSPRGSRTVANGLTTLAGLAALKGFNFNIQSSIATVLKKAYAVNSANGEITIGGLIPKLDILSVPAATHVSVKGAWIRIDFAAGTSETFETNTVNLILDNTTTNVKLIPTGIPSGTGNDVFVLRMEFYQEVNGFQYALNNGAFNTLEIIETL